MKTFIEVLKIPMLIALVPFEITKGSKRRMLLRIKKIMISANLL